MATKKGKTNGHDPMTVRMVELLESIDARLEKLDSIDARLGGVDVRLERLEGEVQLTNHRLTAFQGEVHQSLADLANKMADMNENLSIMRELLGHEAREEAKEVKARLDRLEAAVFKTAAE